MDALRSGSAWTGVGLALCRICQGEVGAGRVARQISSAQATEPLADVGAKPRNFDG